MRFSLDKALGIQEQALYLSARRAQLLAANLANADTPGYKARDIDFRAALAQASGRPDGGRGSAPGTLRTTNPLHIQPAVAHAGLGGGAANGLDVEYRQPSQPSLDGNTVEPQTEMSEFMHNALEYQVSLRFVDGRLKGLLKALRGN